MMNKVVLDRNALEEFLDCILEQKESEDAEVNSLVQECSYSSTFVYSNNYFFSKNIQRKISKGIYPSFYLKNVYDLQNDRTFYMEEFNSGFIEFLLSHTSDLSDDLDTQLRELQNDFVNSNYGKQIRY